MKTTDFVNEAIANHIEKVKSRLGESSAPAVVATKTIDQLPEFTFESAEAAFAQQLQEGQVDNILEHLNDALRSLTSTDAYSPEAKEQFGTFHSLLRSALMKDNMEEFHEWWDYLLGKYPDGFSEFADAAFESAGLGHEGTIEDFLASTGEEINETITPEVDLIVDKALAHLKPLFDKHGAVRSHAMHLATLLSSKYKIPVQDLVTSITQKLEPMGHSLHEADVPTALTYEAIVEAWNQVFPHSSVGVAKAFGGGHTFKFRLAKDKNEVPNGIMDNDPLHYTALLDTEGNWEEYSGSLFVKPPEGANLVYGRVNLRKKNIKAATIDKIIKRFREVHNFVAANAANMKNPMFDVGQKLGMASEAKTPGVALSKAYKNDFTGKVPQARQPKPKPATALTGTYSKTGKPGGELAEDWKGAAKKVAAGAMIAGALAGPAHAKGGGGGGHGGGGHASASHASVGHSAEAPAARSASSGSKEAEGSWFNKLWPHSSTSSSSSSDDDDKKKKKEIKENATGGGTGASSVAVVTSSLGEKGGFSQKDVNKKLAGYGNMLTSPKLVKLPKTNK